MKKRIGLAVLLATTVWMVTRPSKEAAVFTTASIIQSPASGAATNISNTVAPSSPSTVREPASQIDSLERRSLEEMTETLAVSVSENAPFVSLIERLQKSGQTPRVIRDANPYSGEMLIVRTDAPLAGTRYFHAQYFTDESGDRFAQHISFEFKPGPDAMANAVAAVEKNFSGLTRTHNRADYARWKLGDDRVVWVKKLNEPDLQHDPFNAYTKDDVGAVRVAVEQDPHADGHED